MPQKVDFGVISHTVLQPGDAAASIVANRNMLDAALV
jgi:hypothetical protein